MITERTLKKWRRDALDLRRQAESRPPETDYESMAMDYVNKVLRMTQELLDQHLLRREVR